MDKAWNVRRCSSASIKPCGTAHCVARSSSPHSRTASGLMRAVASDDLLVAEFTKLEHDALAETENIILDGCPGSIANGIGR
jgi:hypothetical protein